MTQDFTTCCGHDVVNVPDVAVYRDQVCAVPTTLGSKDLFYMEIG